MKPPKYTGPKKNHSAIWLGESKDRLLTYNDYENRIRVLTSEDHWIWGYSHNFNRSIRGESFERKKPCWLGAPSRAIRDMKAYDKKYGKETIFLGYVKDFE